MLDNYKYRNRYRVIHGPKQVQAIFYILCLFFHLKSWVTSCCFTNFHPNLIIAGTYSGQVVMWDTRSSKRTPIQRSSLSIASHTVRVYCIFFIKRILNS